jgi:hypothetical protein
MNEIQDANANEGPGHDEPSLNIPTASTQTVNKDSSHILPPLGSST